MFAINTWCNKVNNKNRHQKCLKIISFDFFNKTYSNLSMSFEFHLIRNCDRMKAYSLCRKNRRYSLFNWSSVPDAVSHNRALQQSAPRLFALDGETAAALISVEIRNPQGCPRYAARVIKNVKIGPSPKWTILLDWPAKPFPPSMKRR